MPLRLPSSNKFHARKVVVPVIGSDGRLGRIVFDSQKEARRFHELELLKKAGRVREFECHPAYELNVDGQRIGKYTADFRVIWASGEVTIEDTKGFKTRDYILRRKLFDALYAPLYVTEL